MIEELTLEQTELLETYKQKWLRIGLSTDRFDLSQAQPIIHNFYEKILLKPVPKSIVITDSPLSAWNVLCSLYPDLNQVRDQIYNQVNTQVYNNQIGIQIGNQVYNQISNQVYNQVRTQVNNQVWDQVWNQVWNQVRAQVSDFIEPYLLGSFDAGLFSFYDYMKSLIDINPLWNVYEDTSKLGIIYPLDETCIVSQKPTYISNHTVTYADDDKFSIKDYIAKKRDFNRYTALLDP